MSDDTPSTTPLVDALDAAIADELEELVRIIDRHDALVDLRLAALERHASTAEDLLDDPSITTTERARLLSLFRRITTKED